MKNFREITEKSGDTAVFTFGRFNPPTIGHEKLINAIASQQKKNSGSKMYVYPSHSNDPKKNPLSHSQKVAYMRKMFSKYKRNIVVSKARTAIEVAVELYNKDHRAIVMVVGSDRVTEFETMLNEYNGVEGKRHGYYGFDNIEVVSAGERDPDGEGVEGMSATKMRDEAEKGNFDSFKTGIPDTMSDADKKKMYFDVRKGMGIREERDMGKMDIYEEMRDDYLTGKIWNVGDPVIVNDKEGEVVRKGTNYLSYMTEDGKVHKAWLHEIELDEKKSPLQRLKDFDKSRIAVGKKPIFKDKKVKFVKMKKKGLMTTMNVPTDELDKYLKKGYEIVESLDEAMGSMRPETGSKNIIITKLAIDMSKQGMSMPEVHKQMKLLRKKKLPELKKLAKELQMRQSKKEEVEVELDERNYRKEYDNYQGRPEQIARRSSRNKARRVMGDKTKIGMDVGHKDNNPLNNDPKNLKNEDPSKNRREPRLREVDELDETELVTFAPWLKKLKDKLFDKTHSTQLDKLSYEYAKRAAKELRDKKKLNHIAIIHDIAKVYNNLSDRVLKNHINDLVKKGMIPKDLRAEYEPMEEVLSKNASQEDYIDDFVSSGAPQFKGKSKKERIDMAIAAYNSKNEETEIISVIIEKSEESNIPYSILKEVYNRGINTYKENHRPGTTPKEWGIARVNSFITRKRGTWNTTDRDLAEQVKLLENNIQLNINNKG